MHWHPRADVCLFCFFFFLQAAAALRACLHRVGLLGEGLEERVALDLAANRVAKEARARQEQQRQHHDQHNRPAGESIVVVVVLLRGAEELRARKEVAVGAPAELVLEAGRVPRVAVRRLDGHPRQLPRVAEARVALVHRRRHLGGALRCVKMKNNSELLIILMAGIHYKNQKYTWAIIGVVVEINPMVLVNVRAAPHTQLPGRRCTCGSCQCSGRTRRGTPPGRRSARTPGTTCRTGPTRSPRRKPSGRRG